MAFQKIHICKFAKKSNIGGAAQDINFRLNLMEKQKRRAQTRPRWENDVNFPKKNQNKNKNSFIKLLEVIHK